MASDRRSAHASRFTFHVTRWRAVEWSAIIALLLVAAALRFYALAGLPLGLDQDEIINAIAVRGIMAGERPIFITAGWGREPMYAYVAARVVSLTGDMVLGLRLTTVMFSMAYLAVAYVTVRRLLGRAIALMTLGWLAVSFWPLMTARAGERNITLALFTTLAVYLFYRALQSNAKYQTLKLEFVPVGIALGVMLWTYQSGRIMPLVFLAFALYLGVTQRAMLRANWKGIVVFFLVGGLIASPLFVYLATHPGAETGDFKTQSLQALQQGDWRPIVSAAIGTLGMFTVRGEIYWLHNIPGRPVLDWISGALLYVGLAATLWSSFSQRRPGGASRVLVLLWLAIGLVPAMITDPPSHHRAASVMTVIYLLPALGADWLGRALCGGNAIPRLYGRSILYASVAALLAWTAVTTTRDFFGVWATAPEVRDLRFAKLAQLSRDLDRDPDSSPVVAAGTFIEDIEPLVPTALMRRRDIAFRWHDAASAQVIPGGTSRARYFDPATGLRAADADALRRELLARAAATPDVWLAPPGDALPAALGTPAARPIPFDDRVELLGAEISRGVGTSLRLATFWRVLRDGSPSSTAMFAHLTAPDLKIIAQDDRLGFPTHSWRAGDVFAQLFTLSVPTPPPDNAWLELGIYDRTTGKRWQVSGQPGVTRVLVQWSAISRRSPSGDGQWSV